ncbi:hypothetical protein OF385_11010 [Glutamicibacter sp. JL.03c]|uniref:hypothetical protein n=1 Tax=Glutamicibacter sp. JL.03c TaxID=2984842 RepID=UPI0021F713B2|nr:hypothetical protein [Glutamicibacter sp. JL.03c]UYQ76563.1 hypothetical protein OF385_11010 [Glutamicibacter sp. JL.03c]
MLKKVAASAAALTLAATVITGCSSGKLNTEDTCSFISVQVIEKDLQQKADDVSEQLMAGETKDYAKIIDEFNAILGDAASQTKDKKLVEALTAASEQNQEVFKLMAQGTSQNAAEISMKLSALETDEDSEATAYLDEACPGMDSFS